MSRYVLVRVDDDRATHVVWKAEARWTTPEAGGRTEHLALATGRMPVPSDDQLVRDVDWLTSNTLKILAGLGSKNTARVSRLRAAFGLDEEEP